MDAISIFFDIEMSGERSGCEVAREPEPGNRSDPFDVLGFQLAVLEQEFTRVGQVYGNATSLNKKPRSRRDLSGSGQPAVHFRLGPTDTIIRARAADATGPLIRARKG